MGVRTLQTFEQFEHFPDDGMKHELIEGDHIVVPPPKIRHSNIQQRIQDVLRTYVQQRRLGDVRIENGFKLSARTWLQPDVSFIRASQFAATDPDGYLEGGPALAVEVISESNTPAKIKLKMQLYFTHGSEEVWIVDPKARQVFVHKPDGTSTAVGDELRSDLFPGWTVSVDSLFGE